MRVFIGVDQRQPLAYTVLQSSIIRRASKLVTITPLLLSQLPENMQRRGLTDFTFSRYLVPYLCGYQGWAVFMDADMMARGDIHDLMDHARDEYAVQVVKVPQRFEWPALMLFNCEKCTALTPELVMEGDPGEFGWGDVGELPAEFHHVVGYQEPNPDAHIVHFTMGIPAFPEVRPCEFDREWMMEKEIALMNPAWLDLMGKSIHAPKVLERYA